MNLLKWLPLQLLHGQNKTMTIKALYPTTRPTLDLNFAATKRLDPRITYSRASTGTFVGSNGLIQSAAVNQARFDHNPTTGESLGLLVEEQRTNLLQQSETFDNAYWTKARASVSANTVVSPDGMQDADSLIEDATASNTHLAFSSSVAVSTATIYTYTIYAKEAGRTWLNMQIGTGTEAYGAAVPFCYFNLSNGTLGTSGSCTPSITSVGNGWYRCVLVAVATTAATTTNMRIKLADLDSSDSYTGNGTSGIYIWGAQLEAGAFPTSYIPTVASAVTRAADVCTVTNSNIYDTDSFTIINQPFGASAGGSTLTLFDGPEPIKRAAVYTTNLSQATINAAAGKDDEFWRWRVLGESFALPGFVTDGQVTVDWGDGTIETLTTAEHTFSNGGGYHDIGFRLNSGTYFKPSINDNNSIDKKVVALGPAPESIKLNAQRAFRGCNNLEAFDATIDATAGTSFTSAWDGCSSLTSFPLIDTAAGTIFNSAWYGCSSLTSFPLINTAAGTLFTNAWQSCTSLTSFPLINTAAGTNFTNSWRSCSSLTSFPLIDTAAGTSFFTAWRSCSSLTSFPLIDTAAGISFNEAWRDCTSLTSFPLINTAAGTNFNLAWHNCTSLTSFPLINTAAGTNFASAWQGCSSLTSFPLIDTAAGTSFFAAWDGCPSLTSFPLIDTAAGTNFSYAWRSCANLTSFPLINTAAGTLFGSAWQNCSSLTSFPLINTAAGTNFGAAWQNCTSLTSFPLIDTSSGTNFDRAWYDCSSLTSFPLIDTSSGTNFVTAWYNCSSLTDFPANFFDSWTGTPANNCFVQAWDVCSALTATSVENILNSIDTSGQSAPASGVDITIDYNASSGTPSVATAITNLQSRGWTITLNGVLQ
jgi:hypothetical protein